MVIGHPRHPNVKPIDIANTWKSNWQEIHFQQQGNVFTGTYAYTHNGATIRGRIVDGKIDRNKVEFRWDEPSVQGRAILFMNEEGTLLSGKWWNDKVAKDVGLWVMQRDKAIAMEYQMNKEELMFGEHKIELGKKIIMDNLLFVQSKAELLSGSEEVLDKLVTVLKANPNLKVYIH
jgi:outer membrane protein OmpA-like peptidoglycan-associated protein